MKFKFSQYVIVVAATFALALGSLVFTPQVAVADGSPSYQVAHSVAPIGRYNVGAALRRACLGGFFDDFMAVFNVLDNIWGLLQTMDDFLASSMNPPDPLSCVPGLNLGMLDFDFLHQCLAGLPMPSFSCSFHMPNFAGTFQSCLDQVDAIRLPNIDWSAVENCSTPNLNLPDLAAMVQGILGQIQGMLGGLQNVFNPENLYLGNWFINLCNDFRNGDIKLPKKAQKVKKNKKQRRARR